VKSYNIDLKMLSLSLVLCIGGGMLSGSISGLYGDYESFVRPDLYPPGWTFSVIWLILYLLMGISLYIISGYRRSRGRDIALSLFGIQLAMNLVWSPVFFIGSYYLAGSILLMAILVTVLLMIWSFARIDERASIIQIPYVIWLCIALYLSYMVCVLNRIPLYRRYSGYLRSPL
jgi:benzodiazapine receptor